MRAGHQEESAKDAMKIFFGQIYVRPEITFPFSIPFQVWLSEAVSERVEISPAFIKRFGANYKLGFRISAKAEIDYSEIKGPTVFKRDKDVEFTIFLPHRPKDYHDPAVAWSIVEQLLEASVQVLKQVGLDSAKVVADFPQLQKEFMRTPGLIKTR